MGSNPAVFFLYRKEVTDMAEVNSLEVRIGADAEKASQQIDRLVKKLDSVAKSLGSINTSAMSASINELTGKLSAINGKGFSDLNKSAKEAETTIKKVSDTAKKGIKYKISFDIKDYQTVIENLNKKFSSAGKGFKAGDSLIQMQKQADSLNARLDKLAQKEEKIISVGKMSPESSVFQNLQYDINATLNNIDLLNSKMGQLSQKTKDLSNINTKRWNENQGTETLPQPKTVKIPASSMGYNKEAVAGVEAIYQKMYGEAEKAAQKTDSLGNRVEGLKAKLKELSGQGLNFGDAKFDETYRKLNQSNEELKKHKSNLEQAGNSGKSFSERMRNALENVNSQTNKTSSAFGKMASFIKNSFSRIFSILTRASFLTNILTGNTKKLSYSMKGLGGFATKATTNLKSFTRQALSATGIYLGIYGAVRGFKNAIKSSMDYIETLNYFNAAFEQVAKKADLKSFKEMGYDSAEAYYNSFVERAEQLTQKMSGFKIEESGMAISTGEKSLGINPALIMNYQAMFAQMSNSMGIASETAGKLSSVFTRLGADIASLKNEDFQKVWQNMASGMTGMSRAVDKYGMNIREANLQQTLANIGIDKSISKLTQQEKVLLRTIVMLDSSRAAWGDLAKTMNQPANQLRLLQSNWSNLSRTIGNIFLPIVSKVLPYLNAVTIVLQRFTEQIVKLLGFEDFDWGGLGATGGADFDIDFGDAEDDTAGMADNMDKTAKKAKKAVDNLQGFDIINKLQDPNEGKDSDKDKGKGLSPSEAGKLNSALDKLLNDYDKAWNKAFKGMENRANELANKMQKALVDAWNKGDFSELGAKVASWINKGLAKIPWESIKKTVKKTARSIATFLNGFIAGLDWKLIGKTFAEGLNTIIDGAYEFWTTFDWLKFGTSLAEGVNSFIDNFDAEKFGKLLGAKLRGVIQLAFGFVTNLNFEKLGEKIGDAINGFLEDMGKVRQNTGLTGWEELGKTISKGITGFLDTITTALQKIKWVEVGKAIAGFLGNIEWGEILASAGKAIVTALFGVIKAVFSAFVTDPVGITSTLIAVFGSIFVYRRFKALKGIFSALFGQGMKSGIGGVQGLGTTFSQKIGMLTGNSKIETACSKLGKVMGGWISVGLEGVAIESVGGAIEQLGEDIDAQWLEDFGTGFEGFGKAVRQLTTLDFKGFASTISDGAKAIAGAIGGAEQLDQQEANKEGRGEQSKINKKIKKIGEADEDTKYQYRDTGYATKEDMALAERYAKAKEKLDLLSKKKDKKGYSLDAPANLVNTAFYKGTITLEQYEKIARKNYNTVGELADALVEAKMAQKYANGETKKFKDLGKNMNTSLKNIGYSSKELSNVQSVLAAKLSSGELSFENYKEIVGKSYNSTKDLYNQVEKMAGKKVATEVVANVKGAKNVETLKDDINDVNEKNVRVYAETNGINDVETLKTAIGNLRGKTISATISPKLRKDWYKLMQKELLAQTFTINAKTTTKNKITADALKSAGIKSEEGKSIDFSKLASMLKKVNATWDSSGVLKVPKKAKELIKYLNSKSIKYTTYANGGFPSAGQLFIANEAGPELVGNMNGRTTVAPQSDIAEGFAQAITNTLAPVMYAAFKQAASETANTSGGDVYLDGKKITESVIGHVNQISKQRGNSPIWGVN